MLGGRRMLGGSIRREEIPARKLVRSLLESYWASEIMEEFGSSKHCKPVFVQGLYWFPIFIKAPAGKEKDKDWKVTDTVVSGDDILDVAKLIYRVFKAGGRLEAEIATSPISQREVVAENVVMKPGDAAAAEFMLKFEILDLASEA